MRHQTNLQPRTTQNVVIVDSRPDDYSTLLASAAHPEAEFHFCTTAEAAVRLAGEECGLWLVNVELADDNGLVLAEELRSVGTRRRVVLVADEYEPEIERAARILGLPFVCKPAQPLWLTVGRSSQPYRPTVVIPATY